MGYTHYWKNAKTYSKNEWKEICDNVTLITEEVQNRGIALVNGMGEKHTVSEINDEFISLNGVGEDSHETFCFSRCSSDEFCKTANKPYDLAVTSILSYMASVHGFSVSSDGGVDDWVDGCALAVIAVPQYGEFINIPISVVLGYN